MWAEEPLQDNISFQLVDPLNGNVFEKTIINNLTEFDQKDDMLVEHAKSLFYQVSNKSYGKDKYSSSIINNFRKIGIGVVLRNKLTDQKKCPLSIPLMKN